MLCSKPSYCPECLAELTYCTCASDYALVLEALGMDHEPTLYEVAQATIAENRYIRATIDAQLRRTYHAL